MNTQNAVSTIMQNTCEQWINTCKCSEPEDKVKRIYDAMKYKKCSLYPKKICSAQTQTKNMK